MLLSLEGDKAGADLVSLSEHVDTTGAAGKMVFRMMAVLNEFERDQLSERTSAALQHLKAKGAAYGPTPYGYDRQGADLVKNPVELRTVGQMQRWRAKGWSLGKIADRLTTRGISTNTSSR